MQQNNSAPDFVGSPKPGNVDFQVGVDERMVRIRVRPMFSIEWTEVDVPMDSYLATAGQIIAADASSRPSQAQYLREKMTPKEPKQS